MVILGMVLCMINEKNRNTNIDLLKSVATYLVCYSHFNNFRTTDVTYYFTLSGIVGYVMLTFTAYAVPIFLLINGYLIIHREYSMREYIKKIIHTILITFAWGMLYNLIFDVVFNEEKNWWISCKLQFVEGNTKESILVLETGFFGH